MSRALSFLIRYFSNYYTLHRSDLAARAAPLDLRLTNETTMKIKNLSRTHSQVSNLPKQLRTFEALNFL